MDDLLKYENLVYSIIGKYSHYFDQDDLYQVGMLGLIQAHRHFDSSYDIKFSTYAYYYIFGEVNKYIRESNVIRVSKEMMQLNRSIEQARDTMRQGLGRDPTITEISLFLEIDEEKVNEAILAGQEVRSLDYVMTEDGVDLYNSIQTEEKGMSDELLDLRSEVLRLPTEERNLILARYYEELTQTETSKELGISQVQVSRKEGKILEKLRQSL